MEPEPSPEGPPDAELLGGLGGQEPVRIGATLDTTRQVGHALRIAGMLKDMQRHNQRSPAEAWSNNGRTADEHGRSSLRQHIPNRRIGTNRTEAEVEINQGMVPWALPAAGVGHLPCDFSARQRLALLEAQQRQDTLRFFEGADRDE
jgi:hypothetical protein